MKVIIFWEWQEQIELKNKVSISLEELGLSDFIEIEESNSIEIKKELWITKNPALIIEEESIEFKDMIFEWQIPENDEIKSMFMSIIWWSEWSSCDPWWCWSWCSC